MTESQAIEAISAAFVAGWSDVSGNVPFALQNEILPSADAFAQLTVISTGAVQRTTGGAGLRRVARSGWIAVKLWAPANGGMAALAALSEAVRGLLEMVDIPGPDGGEPVNTQAAWMGPVAIDGRWAMALVRIPYTYFETK